MSGSQITEKYEYLTDIITSYDGHEQRIKTRQYPRHLLSYDYDAMDCLQAQWLRGLGRIRQSDTWYIPMWHSPIYLTEDFYYGKALYVRQKDMYSLRDCEWIEIFVSDDINSAVAGKNLVLKVELYQDGIIGLAEVLNRYLDKRNTWIYPLKRCSVQPMGDLSYIFSNGTHIVHNFEDLLDIPVSARLPNKYISNYETYRSKNRWKLPDYIGSFEVLQIEPTWADDEAVKLSVEKAVNRLDNETGMFWYDLKNRNSYDTHTYQYILLNQEMIHNMIRFFHRVGGKWKGFYYPTWANDLQPIKDLEQGDNFILVDWANIRDYYLINSRKKKIVIFTKDWKSYIYDIMSYSRQTEDDKKVGKVLLQQTIRNTISLENILMVSFLNFVRLDNDELQLNYESNEVANTTLVMKEVDDVQ